MSKLTPEEFREYLKTVRALAEGPFEEMQKEVEVTNKFPQEFIDLAIENNLYRLRSTADGASPRRRSCRSRRSSPAARAACACTCTTPPI